MADTNTTWKQVVYDAADAYRTASATTANVKVGELATKISSLEDVTAEVEEQTPLVDQIMAELQGKVGDDANATAETILGGYKAWVQGEKIIGTFVPITGIDYGEVTPSANTASITVSHKLGAIPSFAVIMLKTFETGLDTGNMLVSNNWIVENDVKSYDNKIAKTDSTITFNNTSGSTTYYPLWGGKTYIWFAIA